MDMTIAQYQQDCSCVQGLAQTRAITDSDRVVSRMLSSLEVYKGARSDLVLTFPCVIAIPESCSAPALGFIQTRNFVF